jgi:hypothetical protein
VETKQHELEKKAIRQQRKQLKTVQQPAAISKRKHQPNPNVLAMLPGNSPTNMRVETLTVVQTVRLRMHLIASMAVTLIVVQMVDCIFTSNSKIANP